MFYTSPIISYHIPFSWQAIHSEDEVRWPTPGPRPHIMVLSLVTWFTFRQSSAKMDKTKVNKLAVKLWLTTVIFFFFLRVTGESQECFWLKQKMTKKFFLSLWTQKLINTQILGSRLFSELLQSVTKINKNNNPPTHPSYTCRNLLTLADEVK